MDRTIRYEDQAVSVIVEDEEIIKPDCDSDSELTVSTHSRFGSEFGSMVQRVKKGSNDYDIVKRSFVGGMGNSTNNNVEIVGIHKKNYEYSVMDEARLEVFRVFAAAVASKNAGDPNIKYCWFGGSPEEIREVVLYGFRRFENRCSSYGGGVYLSPASIPMESVKMSVPDSDEVRHVLLCRVILGKAETIYFGAQKSQPSSMNFDSGVDDFSSPTKYIIWEPYMNTHILPVYIVSFQVNSLKGVQSLRIPMSPHMSINNLISHLKNYLSSTNMALIKKLHHEYYKNKISRFTFIRKLREIAGDDVLRVIVQSLR